MRLNAEKIGFALALITFGTTWIGLVGYAIFRLALEIR